MNQLLVNVASREEKEIAAAVFGIECVLREVISLIAANPQKLQVRCFLKLSFISSHYQLIELKCYNSKTLESYFHLKCFI